MIIKCFSFFLMLTLVPVVILTILPSNGVAQDYTQIRLPEGAKARLGKGSISDIVYSPDGTRLAVAGSLGIWIYDVQSGEEVDLFIGHRGGVPDVAFSPNGQMLASGGWDDTIRLWDVDSGTLKHTFTGHKEAAYSVSFSPDGKTIASGSGDDTIRLWDVNSGTLKHTFTGHSQSVFSVAFSPDGKTIASGNQDNTILLWNVHTGTLKHTFTRHRGIIRDVAFSPNGQMLASGGEDGTIRLWDVDSGSLKDTLTGHAYNVYSVAFSPDGQTLASGGWDRTILLWDVHTGTLKEIFTGHKDYNYTNFSPINVHSVSFSPDGQMLASGGFDTIIIWDTSAFVPHTEVPMEDINGDDVVNIQDLVPVTAKVAAERDAKANANQLLWGGATFVLSVVGGYLLDSAKLPVGFFSSGRENRFVGNCLLGSVGVIGAIAYNPLVPSEHLLGKSPEYIMLYTETYKKKIQSLRARSALLGCLGGSLMAGLLLGSFTSQ